MNIGLWLERRSALHPSRNALFLGTEVFATYEAFEQQVRAVAGALIARGIRPGDRVAIFMINRPEYLIALYGIWYAGAAAVPVNAKLHGKEAAFILENSGAEFVFASPAQAEALQAATVRAEICIAGTDAFAAMTAHAPAGEVVARAPDDLAWLFYTSGTTGQPKGVMITHRMLIAVSLAYASDVDQVRPEDAALYAAPLSHGAGLYNMLHVRAGARHVFPASGGFDPAEIFALCAAHGSVHMFAAPTMVKRMTDAADTGGAPGLRTVVYAGGPMYTADILDAVARFGPVFVQIYGQGECPMGITALSRSDVSDRTSEGWQARLASVGRAQSGVEVAIALPDGGRALVGTQGEILVRGDAVMPGYWNNPAATQATLKNGWLHTGDIGVLDAQGYLTLQDRSKDMIITGGSNVYPREVEDVLVTHEHVSEAAVVGTPHADWGEEIVAFIVGRADPAALDGLCLSKIARYKRPKRYVSVDALPKNNYGKVLKTELRARLAKPDAPADHGI